MCGIVGYIGHRAAVSILIEGLRKLEYRGYDSSGIALIEDSHLYRLRAKGKLQNMETKLQLPDLPAEIATAQVGLGHTRWATHGKPEERNAHPHTSQSGRIAVIQNGIVENYRDLRQRLVDKGHEFVTETDTEVVPHLIEEQVAAGLPLLEAVRQVALQLEGSYAIAIASADHPDRLIAVRQHCPLVLGYGEGESFFASDIPALIQYTNRVVVLDNGEIAQLTSEGVEILSLNGTPHPRQPQLLTWNPVMVEKQGFRHFMLKEIHEQPATIRSGLQQRLTDHPEKPVNLNLPTQLLAGTQRIDIVACGTSWHAALVGKYLLEQLAQLPTDVQYASEYRYGPSPCPTPYPDHRSHSIWGNCRYPLRPTIGQGKSRNRYHPPSDGYHEPGG